MPGQIVELDQQFLNVNLLAEKLCDGLETVIKGKHNFVELLITSLISGGHVLIEDMPGLGKTTAARTLASLIESPADTFKGFSRIQFTPDLLPYDITGVDVFHPETGEFRFAPGPVFASVVLADEINRTTPKVQSALLEVMAENQVTVGGNTHELGDFFFVIATQNPVEVEGTYTLPIAQLDRFLMKLSIGYPDKDSEYEIITQDPMHKIVPDIEAVCTTDELVSARNTADKVHCDEKIIRAVIDAAASTREQKGIQTGISPRGSLMLIKAARVFALLKGRDYVIDQDIIDLSEPVLAHRILQEGRAGGSSGIVREAVIESLKRISY
ncbi:MAG: AAA family ATPase [Spirochaetales bacterium]|nr:AAA family ATPase [Spirochaetales bacterium]